MVAPPPTRYARSGDAQLAFQVMGDRPPTLDQQMDDLDAVLGSVGVERVALIAVGDGGMCATYAATHPKRVSALVLVNIAVSGALVVDDERREQMLDLIDHHLGE